MRREFVKLAILLVSAFVVANVFGQEPQHMQLGGRNLELKLVKADDLSPVAWPKESIDLKQSSATTSVDENIYLLLQSHGIAPDSEAFAVVYDLNPSVTDVNSLAPNTSIQVPVVTGGPQLAKLLRSGDLVELTVDADIRNQLNQSIGALQTFTSLINELSTDPQTQVDLKSLLQWYAQIEKRFKRRTDPPLTHASLIAMKDEADVLLALLQDVTQQRQQLTVAQQAQIRAIHDDIGTKIRQYGQILANSAPNSDPAYIVTVNIKGGDLNLISTLRVYYVLNGLFKPLPTQLPVPGAPFDRTGSGTSMKLLGTMNYQVWAARDHDPNHPVTPPHLLCGDGSDAPRIIDLTLGEHVNDEGLQERSCNSR
jgi:hypothetical protein